MIKFIWLCYLILTIYLTNVNISTILTCIYNKTVLENNQTLISQNIIVSLLWSIWYFYYLN